MVESIAQLDYIIMKNLITTADRKSISTFLGKMLMLCKFKLSLLNGFVTVSSYSLYATSASCFPLFLSSVAVSMSTQILNQYLEIEQDRKMIRTQERPLVKNDFNANYAAMGAIGLGALGTAGLYMYNPLAASIGVSIWSGYLFLYTRMKRTSTANTFVGSVIGGLPIYLGWAASGRSLCMIEPFALFMYMVAWQHQHFYGIRWIYYNDYNRAGFEMERSKQRAAFYTVMQTALTMVLVNYSLRYYDISHCYLLNVPATLGLYYWGIRPAIHFGEGNLSAKQLKMASYKHFVLIFGVYLLCGLIGNREQTKEKLKARLNSSFDESLLFDVCIWIIV